MSVPIPSNPYHKLLLEKGFAFSHVWKKADDEESLYFFTLGNRLTIILRRGLFLHQNIHRGKAPQGWIWVADVKKPGPPRKYVQQSYCYSPFGCQGRIRNEKEGLAALEKYLKKAMKKYC